MRLPIPKQLERRLRPAIDRANRFIRDWEWTWTKAVAFSVGFWLFLIVSTSVIPSAWLYFAEKIGWNRSFWLSKLSDFIGVNLVMGPAFTALIAGYLLQKHRRRLRGESGDTRPSGGYR